MKIRNDKKIENGDFQTPLELSEAVCNVLKDRKFHALIEPTCGIGNFIISAINRFSSIKEIYGFDIENEYVNIANERVNNALLNKKLKTKVEIKQQDFFKKDWLSFIEETTKPILVIGNPPWVTNSRVSSLKGKNLPEKSNFNNLNGLDALTGKSNFDISEWMLIKLIEAMSKKEATLVMLCKSGVARKVLKYCWGKGIEMEESSIYFIDAHNDFNVAVDACLLVCVFSDKNTLNQTCSIYKNLYSLIPEKEIGFRDGKVVADAKLYDKRKAIFESTKQNYKWRSGIKHDSSKIMELEKVGSSTYKNGFGEVFELESKYLFPLLKSSDVYNDRLSRKWVVVTQKKIGDDTSIIKKESPKLWNYLKKYSDLLNKRGSVIYKNKPPFSVFGIGDYSFSNWKIAISGFYKDPIFRLIGSDNEKPIMFDDTINFISFDGKEEAVKVLKLLNSLEVREAMTSIIFWDSKRPVTVELLSSIKIPIRV